jgi:large subunit ribosomal protein L15
LNDLHPGAGSKRAKRRVGRGAGSGWGKTAARGQKGQKARSGGGVRAGFEGGQLPLQVRIPKFGFRSRIGMVTAEVRTSELNLIDGDEVTLESLKAANIVRRDMKRARIILSGEVSRAVTVKGGDELKATKGATAAIQSAGGSIA